MCVQEVLESWPLSSVLDLKAILDEKVYDSLLTVSIQERGSRAVNVFLFQSESLRVSLRFGRVQRLSASHNKLLLWFSCVLQADYLKKELERLLQNKRDDHRLTNGRLEDEHQLISSIIIFACYADGICDFILQ